jgi:hypothetical protein
MPVAKIHTLAGQYDEARLGKAVKGGARCAHERARRFRRMTSSKSFTFCLEGNSFIRCRSWALNIRMTWLYEVSGENISFGRGLAQRAHVSAND